MKRIQIALYLFFLIPIFLLVPKSAFSQEIRDFDLLNGVFETKIQKIDYKEYTKGNSNEFQFLASGLFLFYKTFISSQDGNHCVFSPSCSVYTIQSIKKNGFIIGFSDGIDRLMRCNRLSPENYERFETTNLLSDPLWDKHEKE
jgi:uncharacterized protein